MQSANLIFRIFHTVPCNENVASLPTHELSTEIKSPLPQPQKHDSEFYLNPAGNRFAYSKPIFRIHFNINLPSALRSNKCSIYFGISNPNPACISAFVPQYKDHSLGNLYKLQNDTSQKIFDDIFSCLNYRVKPRSCDEYTVPTFVLVQS